jgi:hypothetical protein
MSIKRISRRVCQAVCKDRETGWLFTIILCLVYASYLAWMHVHHEMWRDEVHPWTLARVAHGFWDLVTGDRLYDGHPPMWFWYLRVWTWFLQPAWGIQLATAAAATAAAVFFVRFAPFPRFLKVLALFSFYFAFEYTVMSRNYILGWLCLCGFCTLYHPLRPRHLGLAIVLAAMSLTSFFGLTMSIFLLGFLVLDQVGVSFTRTSAAPPARITLTASPWLLATVVSVLATIVFCVANIEPPDPNPFSPGFNWGALTLSAIPDMLFRLTAAFLPYRKYSMTDFWALHTAWELRSFWANALGVTVLALAVASLWPSWRLMLVYFGAVASMNVFCTVRFEGVSRHWGHFVLLLIAGSWVLRNTYPRRKHWLSTVFLFAIFAFQMEAAVVAMALETKEVFSGGRETAAFIVQQGLQDLPIVAGPDYAAVTVAGYLRRPFIAQETEEINETVVFHSRRRHFSTVDLVNRSVAVARERQRPVLLICNQGLPDPPPGTTRTHLFTSKPGSVADEVFSVYRVEAP